MAAFSSARSAYIRFSLAFSVSSSRNRFTSDTEAPPYLLRHLKNVSLADLLPQQIRHRHATLGVFQNPDDLALTELRLPHDRS